MAFTSAITDKTVWGNLRMHFGTYRSNGINQGGTITTGLDKVFDLKATNYSRPQVPQGDIVAGEYQFSGAWILLSGGAANTFPITNSGGQVGIVTLENASGAWVAFGR